MPEFEQFDAILSRYLDGSITADELAQLDAKLLAGGDFAAHFSRWCLLHRQIAELLTESTLHEIMDQFATGTGSLPKNILKSGPPAKTPIAPPLAPDTNTDAPPGPSILSRWLLWGGLAAATILLAIWLLSHPGKRGETQLADRDAPPRDGEAQEIVATLTQLVGAVWESKAAALNPGQLIARGGRIQMKSGMAKVTFECGAEVVLQGPCDFEIQSQMVGYLKSGKITANVPHRAFSFAILSPQVDFVDLGTAFGVNVGAGGKTELHVFEGEVLCSPSKKDADQRKEPLHVTASSAVAFNAAGGDPSNIAIDKEQFSPLIDLRQTADGAQQRLPGDRLALWLTADTGVTTDPRGRVVSWQDILYGDNRSAEDATQEDEKARPWLVSAAITGHPAVRFDGKSDYLVTTPLETTDDQTVVFVCQFSPSAYDKNRRWGGQILNYDGPPSREAYGYLSNTLQPGVLQIGEPLLAEEFKPTLLTGQVFAGFVGSATVESGRVDAAQVGADTPVVVAYIYDHAGERATLSINGRVYGEARAFAPQAITSRKIIGRHAWKQLFFHGDLAELLIYNQAMSAADLAKTTNYLAQKYSIALDSGASVKQEAVK